MILLILAFLLNLFPIEYRSEHTPDIFDAVDCENFPCPILSARSAPDEYLVKIVAESTEMLTTAYRTFHGEPLKLAERRKIPDLESHFHQSWIPRMMEYCRQRWVELGRSIDQHRPVRMRNEHHPMSIWVRSSRLHFIWTCHYALELSREHLRRPLISSSSPTPHMYIPYLEWFLEAVSSIDLVEGWSNMPTCMHDTCIVTDNVVASYRQWVQRKHLTYHQTIKNSQIKYRRVICWRREPSTRPSYISNGTRPQLIFIP